MAGIGQNSRPQNKGIGNLAQGSAKLPLSNSSGISSGTPIAVLNSATGAGYSEVHTFEVGVLEELYLWCSNESGAAAELTMSFGDSSFGGQNIIASISSKTGLNLVYPGIPHLGTIGSSTSSTLYVRASAASSLSVGGFVVRSYPFGGRDANVYGYYNAEDD
jgi:hypothetical protein